MRFTAVAAATLGFATSVFATPAINNALITVDGGTAALNTSVVNWDGSLIGAIPILSASGNLISEINNGTKTAQASPALSNDEAVTVYFTVLNLQKDVNTTITNLIKRKPAFSKLFLDGAIQLDLKITKNDTDQFAAAIVAKVPTAYQGIAAGVVADIDSSFQQAIAAFAT